MRGHVVSFIRNEYIVTERLLRTNFYTCIGCFIAGIIARYLARPVASAQLLQQLFLAVVSSLVYHYTFDIANQATSVLEDQGNKPYRPIPSGILTIDQAYRRWYISWVLGPVILYAFGSKLALWYGIVWETWIVIFYVWPNYSGNWAWKNISIGSGTFILYRIQNSVISPYIAEWSINIWPELVGLFWLIFTIHIQDYKDLKGDRMSNRQTLPLLLSIRDRKRLQIMTATFFVGFSLLMSWWTWTYFFTKIPILLFTAGIHQFLAFLTAIRTINLGSEDVDGKLYFGLYHSAAFAMYIHVIMVDLLYDTA